MDVNRTQVSLRVSDKVLRQAEALVPRLARDPRYDGIKLCRAAILRIALVRGMRALRRSRDDDVRSKSTDRKRQDFTYAKERSRGGSWDD